MTAAQRRFVVENLLRGPLVQQEIAERSGVGLAEVKTYATQLNAQLLDRCQRKTTRSLSEIAKELGLSN